MSDASMLSELLRAVNDLRSEITTHVKSEADDLTEIRKKVQDRADIADAQFRMSDVRHKEVMDMLEKINIVEALPKTRDGRPDVFGHRDDHETRMAAVKERMDFTKDLLKGGIKAAAGIFLLWAAIQLWQAFLLGPKP